MYLLLHNFIFCLAKGVPILTWLLAGGRVYPSPALAGEYPILGYPGWDWGTPPNQDWGTPQKGPGTSDPGKNLGLGYPRKNMGPVTWERTWDWGTPSLGVD